MSETKTEWKGRTLLFLISQCITLFGSTLVQMAVVWYVTLRTSSGAWVAAFSVCAYLPQFLILFISGVWADRYSRKKLIYRSRCCDRPGYTLDVDCYAVYLGRPSFAPMSADHVGYPFPGVRRSDPCSQCGYSTACTGGSTDAV